MTGGIPGATQLELRAVTPNPLQGLPSLSSDIGFIFDASVRFAIEGRAGGVKGVNEEQTASRQTALLHAAREARVVRTQMRTAQRGSIPIAWTSTSRATKG